MTEKTKLSEPVGGRGDTLLFKQQGQDVEAYYRYRSKGSDGEVLQTTLFRRNQKNFEELSKAVKVNKITPFVGAGASIVAGCSSWPGYLESRAREDNEIETERNTGCKLQTQKNPKRLLTFRAF